MISDLQRHGIVVDHVRRDARQSTSGTVIFTVQGEDRRYLHCIGANAEFHPGRHRLQFARRCPRSVLGGYLAMPSFGPDQLTRLFQEAKRRGLNTVLDVVMPAGASFDIATCGSRITLHDYFFPTRTRPHALPAVRMPGPSRISQRVPTPTCAVIITRGPRGSIARRGGPRIETPPFEVETIDESGAGDAFTAGLITGLLETLGVRAHAFFRRCRGCFLHARARLLAGVFTFEEAVSFVETASGGWNSNADCFAP